ncbi:3-deoxy-8-phosphooctulonate synthase [Myxococcus sp. MISCRS1]|jgi:2-dehydro-3-deoxyphosphooctonate aldolase (KDO 8-P synthase)|uniref:3-deoxy-8-phosphooctulonate synthase n=1 Tax=Myxococcus TaxID=32 RepID=UPI001CC07765|nr:MULTISPECIES: 3-deoxy-8-phosphooctulonate synthase [unclassified Myxococcus]MBZ4397699.1 3-deoxy-8-phosphooctulonate synthase [Myxococcus sp. AS-1-15]MBZ4407735.1 3-deoxy-8-phosphooctulonate synthase [Myxococcus sp. XM-1-1-1]MCY0998435.1 3-deoxy-8-phosphooctulonate synthase [Myxococcus sp. MISCRS1]BDT31575.1 3-deoxy-8-phosphooctulonate synthase [Myxococcus sp. MH1]
MSASSLPITLCGHKVGPGQKLFVIAGPDSIESEEMALKHAHLLKGITSRLGVPYAFKCSYDKANRTSGKSFRGPGLREGLRILARIRDEVGVPVLTDVHETSHVGPASEVVDIIQIPAFLCRQTDLVEAVARSGKGVNLKKGQFVAPKDIVHSARKAFETGNPNVLVTERGSTFGYNNLVVDMRGLAQMREAGLAVCFDATHSVQQPSSGDGVTGGDRKFVSLLARAAAAAGIDALFTEVHEDPDRALCDGPCSLNPQMFEDVVRNVLDIRRVLGHEPG